MAGIKDLPCELIVMILLELDNIRALLPAILASRQFYGAYKTVPRLAFGIMQRQIGLDLLPYSIALSKANYCSLPTEEESPAIVADLLDTLLNEPKTLICNARGYPLGRLMEMGQMHDLVKNFANRFSSDAWSLMHRGQMDHLVLSLTEQHRFYEAFYRAELFLTVRRRAMELSWDYGHLVDTFFPRFPPWVLEQLACVCEYYERRLRESCHDILDLLQGDVYFRSLNDYMSSELGTEIHSPIKTWITEGIKFIHGLETTASLEDQRATLIRVLELEIDLFSFHGFLWLGRDAARGTPAWKQLRDFTTNELAVLKSKQGYDDVDEGPFVAWESSQNNGCETWVFAEEASLPRRYAYVLWDSARISQHSLLQIFAESTL
ncbi:hypothetical protein GGR57DRAFT_501529 [Xylariaceae sp. FL1272]|nr:hypothetical protein GGR57DRAFT_501529 [Xylariaceae sp. FL1272]